MRCLPRLPSHRSTPACPAPPKPVSAGSASRVDGCSGARTGPAIATPASRCGRRRRTGCAGRTCAGAPGAPCPPGSAEDGRPLRCPHCLWRRPPPAPRARRRQPAPRAWPESRPNRGRRGRLQQRRRGKWAWRAPGGLLVVEIEEDSSVLDARGVMHVGTVFDQDALRPRPGGRARFACSPYLWRARAVPSDTQARPGETGHAPIVSSGQRMGAAAATLLFTCLIAAPARSAARDPRARRGAGRRPRPDHLRGVVRQLPRPATGRGLDRSLLAFEEEIPDFTDCDFAAREPDGDWIAVAHEGGPVRGFSEMMPAFRGALTVEQLGRVMSYIRTLCTDARWPPGELNLPRVPSSPKKPIWRMNGWWRATGTSRTAMP